MLNQASSLDYISVLITVISLVGSLIYMIIRLTVIFNKVIDEAQVHLAKTVEQHKSFQEKILDFYGEIVKQK